LRLIFRYLFFNGKFKSLNSFYTQILHEFEKQASARKEKMVNNAEHASSESEYQEEEQDEEVEDEMSMKMDQI
jgi:hypothetical protein